MASRLIAGFVSTVTLCAGSATFAFPSQAVPDRGAKPASAPASRPASPIPLGVGGAPKVAPPQGAGDANSGKPLQGSLTLEQLRQAKETGVTQDGTVNPAGQPALGTGANPPGPAAPSVRVDLPQPSPQALQGFPTATRPPEGKEPKLVFEKKDHDFGEVMEGREVVVDFPFVNDGKGPLEIVNAQPGCGCTHPYIEVAGKPYNLREPIAVGAKGVVRVTLRTAGFGGVDKKTQLDLFTNDPSLPPTDRAPFGMITLPIHANVTRPFVFEETDPRLNFGVVSNAEIHTGSLTLKATQDKPFQVLGVEPMDPNIEVVSEALDATAKRWRLNVSLAAGAPIGPVYREFRVLTNPESLSTKFFVHAELHGPVEVDPASAAFLVISKGRVATKKITIRNHHPSAQLKIDGIRFLDPNDNRVLTLENAREHAWPNKEHLMVTPTEVEKGKVWTIDLVVKETMPPGPFNSYVAFRCGVPGGSRGIEEIRIPISGLVR